MNLDLSATYQIQSFRIRERVFNKIKHNCVEKSIRSRFIDTDILGTRPPIECARNITVDLREQLRDYNVYLDLRNDIDIFVGD